MGAITANDTNITIDTVAGLPGAYPYTLLLDYGQPAEEIVFVTDASGTSLTVTRGQDGTSAQAHPDQAVVRHAMIAQDLRESQTHQAATSGVHGVTGNVVGDSDVQTLTGKTFTSKTVNDPALLVRAQAGQLRNIVEVTNPAGSGTPYVSVTKDGSVKVAGGGTADPFTVVTRVDDATTQARFTVSQDGSATLGSTGDTHQASIWWRLKAVSDGLNYSRQSGISQDPDHSYGVDVFFKNGVEVGRTQIKDDGTFNVKQLSVDNSNYTGAVSGTGGFPVSNQILTKVGPLVVVTFDVANNSGGAIAPIDTNGNCVDTTIARITDETLNPAMQAAVFTFRGNSATGARACGWGYISITGDVVLTEFANQNMRWANVNGEDAITVTASYTTSQ